MSFPTPTITNAGNSMLIQALHGQTVNFTKVKVGSGNEPENIRAMTDLANPLQEVAISGFELGANSITVNFMFSNENVDTEFKWTEMGLFAKAGDEETMFAYANAGKDAETVPSHAGAYLEENTYSLTVIVDSTENLTATVKSLTYAMKEDFENHINAKGKNVHGETAESIGLGNVPNVTTDDQTPTVKEAALLTELKNGDTMATLMGKIAKAIKDSIGHLKAAGENVHKETAQSIGAAAAQHQHSTTEIVSGTLSTARGGTSRASWTENGVVYASEKDKLAQIVKPTKKAVLAQEESGAPYFLPFSEISYFQTGTSAPQDTNILWIDTTPETGGLKYYNGTSWIHVPVAYAAD